MDVNKTSQKFNARTTTYTSLELPGKKASKLHREETVQNFTRRDSTKNKTLPSLPGSSNSQNHISEFKKVKKHRTMKNCYALYDINRFKEALSLLVLSCIRNLKSAAISSTKSGEILVM